MGQRIKYTPSDETIEAIRLQIQETWTEKERQHRDQYYTPPVTVQRVGHSLDRRVVLDDP